VGVWACVGKSLGKNLCETGRERTSGAVALTVDLVADDVNLVPKERVVDSVWRSKVTHEGNPRM